MRYKIWDKAETVYTPGADNGKSRFTAQEWIARHPWAEIPGVKAIIGGGKMNGVCMMEFDMTVDSYKARMGQAVANGYVGAVIQNGMTDREILDAMEEFEDWQPEPEPSPEERIAAALEYQVMSSLEDAE
jgi:hypothetical protein